MASIYKKDGLSSEIYSEFMAEFSKGVDIINETLRKYKIDPRKVVVIPYEDKLTLLLDEALFDKYLSSVR